MDEAQHNAGLWPTIVRQAWHEDQPEILALATLASGLLWLYRREDRRTVAATWLFLLLGLAGLFVGGIAHVLGYVKLARGLHEASTIAEGAALIRLGGFFVFRLVLPLCRFRPIPIVEDIADFIGYCAWLIVRLHYAGLDLSGIVTTSAVMTAVLVFSLQDTLGNILGGLALQLDNSIQTGQWIKVDDVIGRVVEIRWRYTAIETRNWETVIIPNSLLMKGKFSVLGRRRDNPEQWRRWIWFTVGLDVLPGQVVATAQQAVREGNIPNVAAAPPANCVLMDFDVNGARYALRYWLTDLAADDATDSEVRNRLYAALQRAGIGFSFPEYHVHMTKAGEKHEEAKRAKIRHERLEALRRVELFNALTADELTTVAGRMKYAPFAKGDIMTRQGATAHWLYILADGSADISLTGPDGARKQIGQLEPGQFFGEMGLMTGEPRSATVTATSDALCYRLDKESFQEVLHARPELAEEIGRVLAERRYALDNHRLQLDAEARARHLASQQQSLARRIRGFFGLE